MAWAAPAGAESYGDIVQPIFDRHCVECHGADTARADLRLDALSLAVEGGKSGPALLLGNPFESLLLQRVSMPPEMQGVMPPGDREKLSAEEILAISHWISRASYESAGLEPPVTAAADDEPTEGPDGTPWVDFNADIVPILAEACYSCHGSQRQRGDLRVDTPEYILAGGELGLVLVPGDPDASSLFTRTILDYDDPEFMPQSGDPLPDEQIDLLRRWIAQGGSFEERAPTVVPAVVTTADYEPAPDFTPRAASRTIEELTVTVPAFDEAALAAVQATGALALPLARQSPLVRVDFQRLGEPVTGDHLALLSGLAEQVVRLSLAGTEVTDDDLAHLASLTNLVRLDLSNTAITDAGLAHLRDLPRLEYLNLYGTGVTDAGLAHLANIATLRDLYLWQTETTAAAVEQLKGGLPDLVVVTGAELVIEAQPEADAS